MTQDLHAHRAPSASAPARRLWTVTPDDDADLPAVAKALYLATGGDLRILAAGDATPVTLADHPAGYVPVQVRRVLATGTTALDVVALGD
jgi:hypothetical protein